MQKKLTLTADEEVYEGLHKTIIPSKISKVNRPNLERAYSQMSKNKKRESEALAWAEEFIV